LEIVNIYQKYFQYLSLSDYFAGDLSGIGGALILRRSGKE